MIAIIGGGISGLSLAYYLKKFGVNDFVLFEKEASVGGKIQTKEYPSYFLELGPNTLLTTALVDELIKELDLNQKQIFPDANVTKNRYIANNGQITLLPSKPQSLLFSSLLGIKSKLSLIKDLRFKASKVDDLETVSAFFEKHFSKEIVEKLVKTFCRGIYAADADQLLIKSCFPVLVEYQEKYGSVIKGLKANKSLEKRAVCSFEGGLGTFIEALYAQVQSHVRLASEVKTVQKIGEKFVINGSEEFEHLVLANESKSLAILLQDILPETSALVSKLDYSALKVVHSVYIKSKDSFPYQGFGVLFPPSESKQVYGHIWNSTIFSDFDKDKVIITTMAPYIEEEVIVKEIDGYFEKHFSLKKDELEKRNIVEWKFGIPTYNVCHSQFVKKYQEENKFNLYICSNLLEGVSIPDRILQSKILAERLKNEE